MRLHPLFSSALACSFVLGQPAVAGIIAPVVGDAQIDTTFAAEAPPPGWDRMKASLASERAVGFAPTPDGYTIVAVAVPNGATEDVVLFRRGPDGDAEGDLTFTPGFTRVSAMTVDAAGRITVVGRIVGPGGKGDFGVMRVTGEGILDAGFSGDGVASFGFDAAIFAEDAPTSVLAQADGRVVVVGNTKYDGLPSRFSALRVNLDGTLDASFGSLDDGAGGRKGTSDIFITDQDAYAAKVLEMADGYLLVVGTTVIGKLDTDIAARILTPNGSQWANNVGSATFAIDEPGPGDSIYDTGTSAVRVDGTTAVIVGNASGRAAAVRIKLGANQMGQYSTLAWDPTFIGSEIPLRPFRYVSSAPYHVNDVAVRADGSIMLAGRQVSFEGATYGAVERLLPSGARDVEFSAGPDPETYAAPTSAAGDSYSTDFVAVRIDDGRPVLLGTAADASGAPDDTDAVITRLDSSRVTPPPLFDDGFEFSQTD